MGRVTLESALGRRSVRTVLAAGLIPATLLLFGLGASGTPPLAAIESAERGPQQEERPLPRSYHGAAVVNGKIYLIGGAGKTTSRSPVFRCMTPPPVRGPRAPTCPLRAGCSAPAP